MSEAADSFERSIEIWIDLPTSLITLHLSRTTGEAEWAWQMATASASAASSGFGGAGSARIRWIMYWTCFFSRARGDDAVVERGQLLPVLLDHPVTGGRDAGIDSKYDHESAPGRSRRLVRVTRVLSLRRGPEAIASQESM